MADHNDADGGDGESLERYNGEHNTDLGGESVSDLLGGDDE